MLETTSFSSRKIDINLVRWQKKPNINQNYFLNYSGYANSVGFCFSGYFEYHTS